MQCNAVILPFYKQYISLSSDRHSQNVPKCVQKC